MSRAEFPVDLSVDGSVSASDRGLQYGHGIFETMRLYQGAIPLLSRHFARLEAGAKALSLDFDVEQLKAHLDEYVADFESHGVVKLILTAGDAARGYRYSQQGPLQGLVQYFPPSQKAPRRILHLCSYRLPDNPRLAGIKHLNRLDQVMAATEVPPDCDGLLLDYNDNVIEALSSNIFLLHDGQWLTPALDSSGVAGVMRALLKDEILPAFDIGLNIAPVNMDMLIQASEVFICNGLTGIVPVEAIAGIAQWENTSDKTSQTSLISGELSKRYPCFAE